ncbi:MAG: class I SAM-dependent methyltransferase [Minwuiales bacterium]|nr:class I SAM-dependent methyltransferase [Minwuiales bacterium]
MFAVRTASGNVAEVVVTGFLMSSNRYTSGEYLKSNPSWHIEDSPWKAENIRKLLDRSRLPISTVADVGCGAGLIIQELGKIHPSIEFTGYDVSPDAKIFWEQYDLPNVSYQQADFFDQNQRYDLVLCIDVFEHIPDYLGFLNKLKDQADYFVFHIPLDMHIQGLLRDLQMTLRESVGHLHYFSERTAMATLSDSGLKCIDTTYTSRTLDAPKSFRSRILNIPRRIGFAISPKLAIKLFGGWSLLVLCSTTT